jgi:hypothetical protein
VNPRIALVSVLVGALALAGALFAWRSIERSAPPGAPSPGPGGASARSALLAELYDPRTKWAGADGAFIFVGGDRTTVFVTWSLGDPRSLGALEAGADWLRAYQAGGVRVVGIAVPHFAWEADSAAVDRELSRRGMWLPVILDPDLRITRALGLAPAPPEFVMMGPEGSVTLRTPDQRRVALELERMVLGLAAHDPGEEAKGGAPDRGPGDPPRAIDLGAAFSPRGPLADVAPGRPRRFHAQFSSDLEGERWIAYPVGLWSLAADGLTAARGGAEQFVALRYHAVPLGAVMSPPAEGPARVWLLRDGRWLAPDEAADDVRFDGRGASYVEVEAPRLYALCRGDGREHRVTLSPDAGGVTIHGFRFEPVPAVTPSP